MVLDTEFRQIPSPNNSDVLPGYGPAQITILRRFEVPDCPDGGLEKGQFADHVLLLVRGHGTLRKPGIPGLVIVLPIIYIQGNDTGFWPVMGNQFADSIMPVPPFLRFV